MIEDDPIDTPNLDPGDVVAVVRYYGHGTLPCGCTLGECPGTYITPNGVGISHAESLRMDGRL